MDKRIKLYVPKPIVLECTPDGKINYKNLHDYFRVLGTIPGQLKAQLKAMAYEMLDEAIADLYKLIQDIEDLIDEITGILMTDVFQKIKNLEHEMEYKVREFMKEIDIYFQKKIIEVLSKLFKEVVDIINFPIPFLPPIRLFDFFTKEGKVKIKAMIAENLDDIVEALNKIDKRIALFFTGKLTLKIPEYSAEEIWQKLLAYIQKIITDWIGEVIEYIRNLPIIKQVLGVLKFLQDPTKAIQEAMDKIWDDVLQAIEDAKKAAMEAIDELIDTILNFPIPLFGTLGKLIGIDIKEEYRKFKVHMKEMLLARIHDLWNQAMDRIRKFFAYGWLEELYNLLMKLVQKILDKFPILKDIIAALRLIVDIITGNVKICDVIVKIFPVIFDLFEMVYNLIPNDVFEVIYTDYGYEPATK